MKLLREKGRKLLACFLTAAMAAAITAPIPVAAETAADLQTESPQAADFQAGSLQAAAATDPQIASADAAGAARGNRRADLRVRPPRGPRPGLTSGEDSPHAVARHS